MKTVQLITLFLLSICSVAYAGAPDCTTVTDVTSGDSYTASASDCIIRVSVAPSHTAFVVNLPEDGDTFTVQNGAQPYSDDYCDYDDIDQIWICYPRAIEVYSLDRNNTVDGSGSVTDAGMYIQGGGEYRSSDTFTWDGTSNWNTTYDVWYPFTKAKMSKSVLSEYLRKMSVVRKSRKLP